MKKTCSFMRMLAFVFIGFTTIFTSCSDDETLSELTGITSLSIKDVNNVFTVNQGELLIFNEDSLAYGTDVSAVVIDFSTIVGVSVDVNGKPFISGSTLDCTNKISLLATAENGKISKTYTLDVRVSKVNPDAVSWVQKASSVFGDDAVSQRAYYFKDKFWMLEGKMAAEGGDAKLLSSTDGITWSEETIDLMAFPSGTFQNIFVFGEKLYVIGTITKVENWGMMLPGLDNNIWSTEDGISWTKLDDPFKEGWNTSNKLNSAVFDLGNKVVLVGGNGDAYGNPNGAKQNGKIFFGPASLLNKISVSTDGSAWTNEDITTEDFVLRRYSANWVKDGVMYTAGGQGADSELLTDVWKSTDGKIWELVQSAAFTARMKMQVVVYDGKFYMIGGQLSDGNCTSEMLVSEDGATWTPVDEIKALPSSFTPRAGHSVFIDKDNNIWIMGGFSTVVTIDGEETTIVETIKTDIWSGKLNKL